MIALWTVVDEGSDVEVYATAYSVAKVIESRGLALEPEADGPADLGMILFVLNKCDRGRFYEPGSKTWKYKAQAQYNIK